MFIVCAILLSGCAREEKQIVEIQDNKMEETQTLIVYTDTSTVSVNKNQEINKAEETQARMGTSDNRELPDVIRDIELDKTSAKVKISNMEDYEELLGRLEELNENGERYSLEIDMNGTDTKVYIDELLAHGDWSYLKIRNGGIVSVKNAGESEKYLLHTLELYHISNLDTNVTKMLSASEWWSEILIRTDSSYEGSLPIEEILAMMDFTYITVLWDDEADETGLQWENISGTLKEKAGIDALLPAGRKLKGIYQYNTEAYSYTSWEFSEKGDRERLSDIWICVKDTGSSGEQYMDLLDIPKDRVGTVGEYEGPRFRVDDVNFDGYPDLIFRGENFSLEANDFIGFLWNEHTKKYAYNGTMPKRFKHVDPERKRLIFSAGTYGEHEYYIYEYLDGVFKEKRLEVEWVLTEGQGIVLTYYEEDRRISSLNILLEEGYYIFTDKDGTEIRGEVSSRQSYDDLGKLFYPEFDFYSHG